MTSQFLAQDIEREEARQKVAYPDPLSPLGKACQAVGIQPIHYRSFKGYAALSGKPWTIGIGCTGPDITPSTVWTDEKIDEERDKRLADIKQQLDHDLPWWRSMSDVRQDVLVQMAWQQGVGGLLKFHHALEAMRAGDYITAAAEMLNSQWAAQTQTRAKRMARQMQTGVRAWA